MAKRAAQARAAHRTLAAAAIAFFCCYYVWSQVPTAAAASVPQQPLHAPSLGAQAAPETAGSSLAARTSAASAAQPPMVERPYACRDGFCNDCSFRKGTVTGPERPFADGSSAQERVNGTVVSREDLAADGIRYFQVGGDWWNKCGDGWLNADMIFTRIPSHVVCQDWRTGRHIMRLVAGRPLPFESESFDLVYSEHMFEHILPMDGSAFIREAYRVLRPGGVLRITTPDLAKYLYGYVNRKSDPFLQNHAKRFPPMGKLGEPYTAASVVNNIFRNYEHRWIYDFEELSRTAQHAGVPASAIRNSARMGDDLPPAVLSAIRATEKEATARHQRARRENPTRCWLEQEVRSAESLYVTIQKPEAAPPY